MTLVLSFFFTVHVSDLFSSANRSGIVLAWLGKQSIQSGLQNACVECFLQADSRKKTAMCP